MKAGAVVAAAIAATGCGASADAVEWAQPQTVTFHGASDCGPKGRDLAIRVERLVLHRTRWRVDAEIVNRTGTAVQVGRPHHPGRVEFGVDVFESPHRSEVRERAERRALHTGALAQRVEPPLGHALQPGQRWRGSFSGAGRFPRGRYVRVELGRFTFPGRVPPGFPARFFCVTDDAARLR